MITMKKSLKRKPSPHSRRQDPLGRRQPSYLGSSWRQSPKSGADSLLGSFSSLLLLLGR